MLVKVEEFTGSGTRKMMFNLEDMVKAIDQTAIVSEGYGRRLRKVKCYTKNNLKKVFKIIIAQCDQEVVQEVSYWITKSCDDSVKKLWSGCCGS